ncbi:Prophage CP4-57 regulatory protein (AlpA) [Izhakiella capsodis]|uniref:Prophage CP4-57 regulatory protein (AlpA) n=1 Tax=Izhakiella capsodis TaxID=1367852 RepID=A0A1I5BV69_9GAMM|nr:AlpA family phage regulatory protein [Izhakiella capsodis]SFN78577.1 Prophage CP4-57 regulatory protein (AlpA) [Izhakiella capsodis]
MSDLTRVKEQEVMDMVGVRSRMTIYKYTKCYNFPKPITMYPKQYLRADVEYWILNGGINQRSS